MKKLEAMEADNKKEILTLRRELEKLRKTLGGIKDMATIPEIMFVIDPKEETGCALN
ncbi:ribosomal protein S2 domain protein [Leptospira santarosai str. HAI134]|nr:ribosomal protein S2 domain protein [Leptospira santarosai str. HAI134]